MTYKELIKKYIDVADDNAMEMLTHETDCFVEEIREGHPELVEDFLLKVDMALNPGFSMDTVKHVVSGFKNKDGTSGEHWDYETTTKVLKEKGYSFKPCNWYFALNKVYSVFYKTGRSDDTYIELAHDYLADKNSSEDLVKKCWMATNR